MSDLADLVTRAKSRALPGMSYAGEVTVREAWEMLQQNPLALLVDVRTPREWQQVGVPDLSPAMDRPLFLTWEGEDGSFIESLKHTQPEADLQAPVFFLCRVGGRSSQAAQAAAAHGFSHAFNITHGFEGDPDTAGERCRVNGWIADGLPWKRVA